MSDRTRGTNQGLLIWQCAMLSGRPCGEATRSARQSSPAVELGVKGP